MKFRGRCVRSHKKIKVVKEERMIFSRVQTFTRQERKLKKTVRDAKQKYINKRNSKNDNTNDPKGLGRETKKSSKRNKL